MTDNFYILQEMEWDKKKVYSRSKGLGASASSKILQVVIKVMPSIYYRELVT